jgi:hypothetical protein
MMITSEQKVKSLSIILLAVERILYVQDCRLSVPKRALCVGQAQNDWKKWVCQTPIDDSFVVSPFHQSNWYLEPYWQVSSPTKGSTRGF